MTTLSRLLLAFIGILLLFGVCSSPALADGPPPPGSPVVVGSNKGRTTYTATVTTNSRGVWIDVRASRSSSGSSMSASNSSSASAGYGASSGVAYAGSGSIASNGSTETVTRTWTNAQGEPYYEVNGHVYHLAGVNIGWESEGPNGWYTTGSRQHPGSVPEALYVNGQFQGIIWVPYGTKPGSLQWGTPPAGSGNQTTSAPVVVDPRAVALYLLRHVPLPNLRVRMNPRLGLVNLPGWFWAEGYNGQPFGGSVTVGSYTISVRVWPASYQWSFGDGSTLVSPDLGQPYPAASDIRHTYQYSSLHYPDGFPVRLTVQFAAAFSVNGGGLEALLGMERTYTTAYRVQELQSILTHH